MEFTAKHAGDFLTTDFTEATDGNGLIWTWACLLDGTEGKQGNEEMQAGEDWNRTKNAENTKGILLTTDFTDATDGNGLFWTWACLLDGTEGKQGNEEMQAGEVWNRAKTAENTKGIF